MVYETEDETGDILIVLLCYRGPIIRTAYELKFYALILIIYMNKIGKTSDLDIESH